MPSTSHDGQKNAETYTVPLIQSPPKKGKPDVGDFCFYRDTGSRHQELAVVIGHGPDNTVNLHVLGVTHKNVKASNVSPFILTDDGNIPAPPASKKKPEPEPETEW